MLLITARPTPAQTFCPRESRREAGSKISYVLNTCRSYLCPSRPWSPPVGTSGADYGGADYQVVSGLVFTELSDGYIAEFGLAWTSKAPQELVFRIEQRQLPAVVVCEILADPATAGLASLQHRTLTGVNGARVRTLHELRDALRKSNGYTAFEFSDGARVAFETSGLSESTRRVLERHNIGRSALRSAQGGAPP